jgi:hypothetical protein
MRGEKQEAWSNTMEFIFVVSSVRKNSNRSGALTT